MLNVMVKVCVKLCRGCVCTARDILLQLLSYCGPDSTLFLSAVHASCLLCIDMVVYGGYFLNVNAGAFNVVEQTMNKKLIPLE